MESLLERFVAFMHKVTRLSIVVEVLALILTGVPLLIDKIAQWARDIKSKRSK